MAMIMSAIASGGAAPPRPDRPDRGPRRDAVVRIFPGEMAGHGPPRDGQRRRPDDGEDGRDGDVAPDVGTRRADPRLAGHGRRGEDRRSPGDAERPLRMVRRGPRPSGRRGWRCRPSWSTTTGGRSREFTWGRRRSTPTSDTLVDAARLREGAGTRKWTRPARTAREGGADGQGEVEEGQEGGEGPEARPREDRGEGCREASGCDLFRPQGPAGSASAIDGIPLRHRRGAACARSPNVPSKWKRSSGCSTRRAGLPCANRQPWRFVVVGADAPSRAAVEEASTAGNAWAKRAPVLIAAGARRDAAVVESRDYFLSTRNGAHVPPSIARSIRVAGPPDGGDGRRDRCGGSSAFREDSPAAVVARRLRRKSGTPTRRRGRRTRNRGAQALGRSPSVSSCGGSRSRRRCLPPAREGYETELVLRFGDTDAMGHVNNAKVVTLPRTGPYAILRGRDGGGAGWRTSGSSSPRSPAATGSPSCFTIASSWMHITDVYRSSPGSAAIYDPRRRAFVEAETVQVMYDCARRGALSPWTPTSSPRPGTTSEDKGSARTGAKVRSFRGGKQRRVPLREGRVEEREHGERADAPSRSSGRSSHSPRLKCAPMYDGEDAGRLPNSSASAVLDIRNRATRDCCAPLAYSRPACAVSPERRLGRFLVFPC